MVQTRRKYDIALTVNGITINKVIIDPHFEENHSESINDEVILLLVKLLDGKEYEPVDHKSPYAYFVSDDLKLNGKPYRLIWLLDESESMYIGVINAYRRRE